MADGITGHVIGSAGTAGFPWAAKPGATYLFDLMAGSATPASRKRSAFGRRLAADFTRHLSARSMPSAWTSTATMTLSFGPGTARDWWVLTCRVEVTDDRGTLHRSTRRRAIRLPSRGGVIELFRTLGVCRP